LSILDSNNVPIGPTFAVGPVTLLPAAMPPDPKDVKVANRLNQPIWGDITILGSDMGQSELSAGESLQTDIVWTATSAVDRDLAMRLQLVDKEGKTVGGISGRPVGNAYPTSMWRQGEILRGQYRIPLAATSSEGDVDLVLTLVDASSEEELASLKLGTLKILPRIRSFSASPTNPLSREFAQTIRLLGYDLAGGNANPATPLLTAAPGDVLTVAPYWQAMEEMNTSYTAFVQVLNTEGKLVAQNDSIPAKGKEPTTSWLPGQIVIDDHTVLLPSSLPDGNYTIITGLYDDSTGKRLSLADGSDLVTLASLRVAASGQ
jgi:hypothetical protein